MLKEFLKKKENVLIWWDKTKTILNTIKHTLKKILHTHVKKYGTPKKTTDTIYFQHDFQHDLFQLKPFASTRFFQHDSVQLTRFAFNTIFANRFGSTNTIFATNDSLMECLLIRDVMREKERLESFDIFFVGWIVGLPVF